jgi:hypothetical protein
VQIRNYLRTRLFVRAVVGVASLATAMWFALATSGSFAQTPEENTRQEYNVKLAFLFNFGRYVSWPGEAFAQSDSPFVIGVLGPDPFGGAMDRAAASRKLQGRAIEVRHFSAAGDYRPCQMLFITRAVTAAERDAILRTVGIGAVLVVGEADGFAANGGSINLYRDQENVRFELNVETLRTHKLQADAKLLSLARIVKGN